MKYIENYKIFEKKAKKLDPSIVESEFKHLIDFDIIETADDIFSFLIDDSKLYIKVDYSNDSLSVWDETIVTYIRSSIESDEENGYTWEGLTRETLSKIKSKPEFVYFVEILNVGDETTNELKSKEIVDRLKKTTGYNKIFSEYNDYLNYLENVK